MQTERHPVIKLPVNDAQQQLGKWAGIDGSAIDVYSLAKVLHCARAGCPEHSRVAAQRCHQGMQYCQCRVDARNEPCQGNG